MNTKSSGNIGEQLAAEYLQERGYKILERNAKYCGCEVDIICEAYVGAEGNPVRTSVKERLKSLFKSGGSESGERTVIFCEVKTRYGSEYGEGIEAVTAYKIGRYVTAAKEYAVEHSLLGVNIRFDVLEVGDFGVRHTVNAFDGNDAKYAKKYRF